MRPSLLTKSTSRQVFKAKLQLKFKVPMSSKVFMRKRNMCSQKGIPGKSGVNTSGPRAQALARVNFVKTNCEKDWLQM